MSQGWLLVLAALLWVAHGQVNNETQPAAQIPVSQVSIVFDRLVSFPADGKTDVVLLRNIGGEAVDMRGWWLADSKNDKRDPERSYFFAQKKGCEAYSGIPAGGVMELTPLRKANPCGIPFGVSIRESLHLYDADDNLVAQVSWDWSLQGLVMRRMPDGSYRRLQESLDVVQILESDPDLYLFKEALQVTGLYDLLRSKTDESKPAVPGYPLGSVNDALPFQLPELQIPRLENKTTWPIEYKSVPYEGIPESGPYTIFAPRVQTMRKFFKEWPPARGLSEEEIFELPEFKQILLSHIFPGAWMTGYIFHNSKLSSASGAVHLALKDRKVTGGKLRIRQPCSDVSPSGQFTCEQQRMFGKCRRDYIKQKGYCLDTCGLCNCDSGACAEVVHSDIYAKNGIVHIIDSMLPTFTPSSQSAGSEGVAEVPADENKDGYEDDDQRQKDGGDAAAVENVELPGINDVSVAASGPEDEDDQQTFRQFDDEVEDKDWESGSDDDGDDGEDVEHSVDVPFFSGRGSVLADVETAVMASPITEAAQNPRQRPADQQDAGFVSVNSGQSVLTWNTRAG